MKYQIAGCYSAPNRIVVNAINIGKLCLLFKMHSFTQVYKVIDILHNKCNLYNDTVCRTLTDV
jgi:hypothetical protein